MGLRENLYRDSISQLPLRAPLSVSPKTTVRETVEAMRLQRTGCALICLQDQLIGIFTERDLMRRVLVIRADQDSPIERYMTPRPATLRASDPIASAIRLMFQGHYRHLPVVDSTGRVVGVASVKHIVTYLVDYFPSTVYNLPPQPRQVQEAREGA